MPIDGKLYIKRAANKPHVPRDTPEIPIRVSSPDDPPETDAPVVETQPLNQPNAIDFEYPNAHTDFAGQIVAYLKDTENHTATMGEMKAAFDCSPEGLNKAIKTLIEAGRIYRIKRGVYQLINR